MECFVWRGFFFLPLALCPLHSLKSAVRSFQRVKEVFVFGRRRGKWDDDDAIIKKDSVEQ